MDDADAMADPHLAARGYFVEVEQADTGLHRYPGFPYRFHNTPLEVRLAPVGLGEHNEYVYKTLLGVSDAEYAELEAEGHIGTEFAPHIR
jgi:crotonobetainyl-CoA:carnitine CoA-transferase CaiB-like acyl-CoA transferase